MILDKELNAQEILAELFGKELNTKKNILEYIEVLKKLKEDEITAEQMQDSYTLIYTSIEDMIAVVKTNTIMHLKNQLKSALGKKVENKDPKKENHFIEFFKEAYPPNKRKKDFTWVLMDINKITEEQIWTTLAYIGGTRLKEDRRLTTEQKEDIIVMVERLIKAKNIKYVNQVKSLSKLLNVLKIKIISSNNAFKVKREV